MFTGELALVHGVNVLPFRVVGVPFVSAWVVITPPVVSLTKITAPATGLLSGTPIGSAPAVDSFCLISTRALALMAGTKASLKNQGRSASVIFTSIILAAHGVPSIVSSGGGPPTSKRLRLIRAVTVPWFAPPTWALNLTPCVGSPAYFRASFSIATLAALASPKHLLKRPPPAKAPASACIWRWRLCSNQLPTSNTSMPKRMITGSHRTIITRTAPRSDERSSPTRRISRAPRRIGGRRRFEAHRRGARDGRRGQAPKRLLAQKREPVVRQARRHLNGVPDGRP